MDRGSVWWGTKNGYGLTWLSVRLIEQGIGLHYGRVHHPQTQGKVERFHRTLDEAMRYRGKPQRLAEWPEALEEFRQIYNEQRPHEALEMKRPAERYRVSARSYEARPQEWEYPSGSTVRRAERRRAVLDWEGQQWFVCEALAERRVQVEKTGRIAAGELPAHVRAGDRSSPRQCTRALVLPRDRWQGSPVALRAPCEPCQRRRKPRVRSVTDVLIHGVTHVMIQNS